MEPGTGKLIFMRNEPHRRKLRAEPRRKGGAALVLVLAFLVLISGLVLAFFSSVTDEMQTAKTYAAGASTKELADSAVHSVMGAIGEATSRGPNVAWASQPGMIRTYADPSGNTSGNPLALYKLYSSNLMVVPAAQITGLKLKDETPMDWDAKPALFTDLNSPVMVADPAQPTNPPQAVFPILDPGAKGNVEGFDFTAAVHGAVAIGKSEDLRIPMPVRWIYMLRDGTLCAPADVDANGIAIWQGVTQPSATNPIVGRIAYWTDDETAKVNINTASEGVFGDTPVCNTQPLGVDPRTSAYKPNPDKAMYEYDLTEFKGARNEFQRYPGHPATTCLSPILGKRIKAALSLPADPVGADRAKYFKAFSDIIPRVTSLDASGNDYSSQGGIRRAGPPNAIYQNQFGGFHLKPDSDRLFASVDELLFKPLVAGSVRTEQTLNAGSQNTPVVEQSKFFLTAQSRAPEVNLYNKPRIAIWPLQVDESKRTHFDKLIAFCGSLGARGNAASPLRPFYFTRQDPTSPTVDWSQRNGELFKYLQQMTGRAVPGWDTSSAPADSFSSKYTSAERDQILTEIFDYIRCTNLTDYSDPAARNAAYTPTGYSYGLSTDGQALILSPESQNVTVTRRGQVVPIEPPIQGGPRGMGRIATISELALVVMSNGRPLGKDGKPSTDPADKNRTALQFALVPELFSPLAGASAMALDLRIKFKNVQFTVSDGVTSSNPFTHFPAGATGLPDMYSTGRLGNMRNFESKLGGLLGFRQLMENETGIGGGSMQSAGSPANSVPPTGLMTVSAKSDGMTVLQAPTITLSGTATAELWAPATNGTLLQTFEFKFPQCTLPIPNRAVGLLADYKGGWVRSQRIPAQDPIPDPSQDSLWQAYFYATRDSNSNSFDVIRSTVATGNNAQGDFRLIAGSKNPGMFFGKPQTLDYDNHAKAGVHSLRYGFDWTIGGAQFGSLVTGMTEYGVKYQGESDAQFLTRGPQGHDHHPAVPEGINGVTLTAVGGQQAPGDWDNGPGVWLDGPLCNKADEGLERHRGAGGTIDNGIETQIKAPYLGWYCIEDNIGDYASFFSPNRQIPSAVMFGSLPTGVARSRSGTARPWQTLLFRPAKPYLPGGKGHPGSALAGPPDHLLLDLFWMPVVEPYAISEPLATAGKINMNFQIAPFTYIKRDTGMRAVLQSTKLTALNPNQKTGNDPRNKLIQDYKCYGTYGDFGGGNRVQLSSDGHYPGEGVAVRQNIDIPNTLLQLQDRFDAGKIFVSASEICDIPLIPSSLNLSPSNTSTAGFDSQLSTFWAQNRLTGDNSLEKPYAAIYPRITTKSNSYTVHFRVQTLRQAIPPGAAATDPRWAQWNEARDSVLGEYRGSSLIERYIDPQDPQLTAFDEQYTGDTQYNSDGTIAKTGVLDAFYKFRVLSTKKFSP